LQIVLTKHSATSQSTWRSVLISLVVGIDTRASGVVLTPAYVKIIQLRLEDMGTVDVKLVLLETECMPLLSPNNFDKWAQEGTKDKWNEMKGRLYPSLTGDHRT
jgi:hypothetical protein